MPISIATRPGRSVVITTATNSAANVYDAAGNVATYMTQKSAGVAGSLPTRSTVTTPMAGWSIKANTPRHPRKH
ncbi:hypothetical protein [Dyella tabacisoli]|uniref:hypothetical protein n=1 Tax=Dyella tabacisoli TaxID=2282381 RepID=UPI0013B3A098|nr:hypothetical protein [Dyella tabacisoli]